VTGRVEIQRPTLQPYTTRVMLMPAIRRHLPRGFWSVFSEASDLLIWAEHVFLPAGLTMQAYDLLDGSVGKMYSRFRENKPWTGRRINHTHKFPDGDRRGECEAAAYEMRELQHFREWLHLTYIPVHFPAYLIRKYGHGRMLAAAPKLRELGMQIPATMLASN
jgi:hypothetical protein